MMGTGEAHLKPTGGELSKKQSFTEFRLGNYIMLMVISNNLIQCSILVKIIITFPKFLAYTNSLLISLLNGKQYCAKVKNSSSAFNKVIRATRISIFLERKVKFKNFLVDIGRFCLKLMLVELNQIPKAYRTTISTFIQYKQSGIAQIIIRNIIPLYRPEINTGDCKQIVSELIHPYLPETEPYVCSHSISNSIYKFSL